MMRPLARTSFRVTAGGHTGTYYPPNPHDLRPEAWIDTDSPEALPELWSAAQARLTDAADDTDTRPLKQEDDR